MAFRRGSSDVLHFAILAHHETNQTPLFLKYPQWLITAMPGSDTHYFR